MPSCPNLIIGKELVKVRNRAVWLCKINKQGDKSASPITCYTTPCGRKSRECAEPDPKYMKSRVRAKP